MDIFTGRLWRTLDRPVIDMTELPGDHDFTLTYTDRGPPPNRRPTSKSMASPSTYPASSSSTQCAQLGLHLDPRKGAAPVMVFEHIDKPDGNYRTCTTSKARPRIPETPLPYGRLRSTYVLNTEPDRKGAVLRGTNGHLNT
jgi:hypothetical protein